MTYVNQGRQVGTTGVPVSWEYGGGISGFAISGMNHHDVWCGNCGTGVWYYFTDIQTISLTTDGNAVDSGGSSLKSGSIGGAVSGVTHSYVAGGASGNSNAIERFANANPGAGSTDVGDLATAIGTGGVGVSSIGNGHGYVAGPGTVIQKYNLVSTSAGATVGNLAISTNTGGTAASASDTGNNYGYVSGGMQSNSDAITRFSFDNEATTDDVGNLGAQRGDDCGGSSETHGYQFGGGNIYKYAFASSSGGPDVGNLINGSSARGSGFSSTTHSYASGGEVHEIHMEKFAHASDGTSSFVGNLGSGQTTNRCHHANTHY